MGVASIPSTCSTHNTAQIARYIQMWQGRRTKSRTLYTGPLLAGPIDAPPSLPSFSFLVFHSPRRLSESERCGVSPTVLVYVCTVLPVEMRIQDSRLDINKKDVEAPRDQYIHTGLGHMCNLHVKGVICAQLSHFFLELT